VPVAPSVEPSAAVVPAVPSASPSDALPSGIVSGAPVVEPAQPVVAPSAP
jgi:hypothetical protein